MQLRICYAYCFFFFNMTSVTSDTSGYFFFNFGLKKKMKIHKLHSSDV